ncbi:hypothetical protein BJQ90_03538 [Arthrobacter sp. SO3]|nr:hypothetical protein [Arthrobacter sp. SO3]
MAAGNTCRPSASSRSCTAAPRLRRRSWRSAGHSLCQAPSGRSSLKLAAARCSCAAWPGACRAALRTRTDSTGFCFCGIAEDPPRPAARGSASSATSGRLRNRTSEAILPAASVTAAKASPRDVTASRFVCHGAGTAARPSSAASRSERSNGDSRGPGINAASSASTVPAARVPAAPPVCTGNSRASSRRAAAASPWNHWAALSPKLNGRECWVRLRPTHNVSACRSARAARAAVVARSSVSSPRTASRASRIRAESSTSWLVSEVCTAFPAPIPAVSRALTCPRRSASKGITGLAPPWARTAMPARS